MLVDFATYIVQRGVATPGQVQAAMEQQSRSRPPIGRIALHARLLGAAQVFSILAHQARHAPIRFGEAAVALSLLKPAQVDELLRLQRKQAMSLEDILVRAGVIDKPTAFALRKAYELENPPSISGTMAAVVPRSTRRSA